MRENNELLAVRGKNVTDIDAEIQRLNQMITLNMAEIAKINGNLAKFNLSEQRENHVTLEHIERNQWYSFKAIQSR